MATIANLVVNLLADTTRLERDVQRSVRMLDQQGQLLQRSGLALTAAVTAPLVGFGVASVKAFSDFDDAMTKSTAIMGTVSETLREKMEAAARDVGKTTTFSATQAAESYFFLASAGLDAAQSIEAMPRVAKFAQAGNFDLALATDLLTDAQSALGMTVRDDVVKNMENMNRVSDVLVKANVLANASVQQFSEALTNQAGPAIKSVGKDIEEGVAVLAAFADQGIKGEDAGTKFSIVMRDLQTKAIENTSAFDEMNIAVFDSHGEMNNLGDIIGDVEQALAGMSDEQKKATLLNLGFTDKSVGVMLALLGTSDAIHGYEAALRSAGGITEEVAGRQLESFKAKLQLLWGRLTDVAITVGDTLAPTLEDLIEVADPVLEWAEAGARWFAELPAPIRLTALGVLALVAALGPLVWITGSFMTSAAAMAPLLKLVGSAFGAIAAPVTTATAAINATAPGLGMLLSAGRSVVTFLTGSFMVPFVAIDLLIRAFTGNTHSLISVLWDLGTVIGSALYSILSDVVGVIRDVAMWLGTKLLNAAKAVWDWLKDLAPVRNFTTAIRTLGDWTTAAADKLHEYAEAIREDLPEVHERARVSTDKAAAAFEQFRNRLARTVPEGLQPVTAGLELMWQEQDRATQAAERAARLTEEQRKALEKFNEELRKFGGADAVAAGQHMLRILESLGGPLGVLPSQLEAMQTAFLDAAAGARTLGDVQLAEQFEALARQVDPLRTFQERYNVKIGEYVPLADTAEASTDALYEQFYRLTGQVTEIPPKLQAVSLDLKKLTTGFKEAVQQVPPESRWAVAWRGMKDGLGQVLDDIPSTLVSAFTGGGNIMGAIQGIATQVGSTLGGGIGFAVGGPLGESIGSAIGSLLGPLVGKIGSLFGGVSQAVKEARADVDAFQQSLWDTLTPQQQIEAGGRDWAKTVIAVRDAFTATGRTAEEAYRVVEQLWDTDHPDRARAAIEQINAVLGQAQAEQDILNRAIEEYGFTVEELGPKFRAQQLSEQAQRLVEDYAVLIESGIEQGTVTQRMADKTNEFLATALRTNAEIPRSMEPMLAKMLEQGLLTDQNGEKLTSLEGLTWAETMTQGFDRVVGAVERLIRAIGGDLPGAAGAAGDTIVREFGRATDAAYTLGDAIDDTIEMHSPTGLEGIAHYAGLAGQALVTMASRGISAASGLKARFDDAAGTIATKMGGTIAAVNGQLADLLAKVEWARKDLPGGGPSGDGPSGPLGTLGNGAWQPVAMYTLDQAIEQANMLARREIGRDFTAAEIAQIGDTFGYRGEQALAQDEVDAFLQRLRNTYIRQLQEAHSGVPNFDVGTLGRFGSFFHDWGSEGRVVRVHNEEAIVRRDQAGTFAAAHGSGRQSDGTALARIEALFRALPEMIKVSQQEAQVFAHRGAR